MQVADLGDDFIELLDVLGKVLVTRLLVIDLGVNNPVPKQHQAYPQNEHQAQRNQELLLEFLPLFLTPGE